MTHTDDLASALDDYVPGLLRAAGVPGLSLAVADAAGVVLERAWGIADLASDTPMDPSQPIPVGSLGKPLVAMAALQLQEDGEFSIHDPVETLLDFRVQNPYGRAPITPYHLMTHCSGLRTDTPHVSTSPVENGMRAYLERLLMVGQGREYANGSANPLWVAPVGSQVTYSSVGIALLAAALEEPAGESFSALAKKRIFGPLRMERSAFPEIETSPPTHFPNCATGYMRFGRWCFPTPKLYTALPPSAGLVTTVGDYLSFIQVLMDGQGTAMEPVLSANAYRHMLTPQQSGSYPGEDLHPYGLALEMGNVGERYAWAGHGGCFPLGWWTESRIFPELGLGVVAAQNAWDMTRWLNPITRSAAGIACDFIARWWDGYRPEIPRRPLPYQNGYAHGVLVADRITGVSGAGALTDDAINEMTAGARPIPYGDAESWAGAEFADAVREGFADAVRALRNLDGTNPDAVARFLRSSDSAVSIEDLASLALAAGASRAVFPVPFSFFSARVENPAQRTLG